MPWPEDYHVLASPAVRSARKMTLVNDTEMAISGWPGRSTSKIERKDYVRKAEQIVEKHVPCILDVFLKMHFLSKKVEKMVKNMLGSS